VEQPKGYVTKGKEKYVCKFKKALYGFKQVTRTWYERILRYLMHAYNYGLFYGNKSEAKLYGYCNSDLTNNIEIEDQFLAMYLCLRMQRYRGRVKSNKQLLYLARRLNIWLQNQQCVKWFSCGGYLKNVIYLI